MGLLPDCALNERCLHTRRGTATEALTKGTIRQRIGKGHLTPTVNRDQGHRSRQARNGQGLDSMKQSQAMIMGQGGRVGDGATTNARPLEVSPGISTDHNFFFFVLTHFVFL